MINKYNQNNFNINIGAHNNDKNKKRKTIVNNNKKESSKCIKLNSNRKNDIYNFISITNGKKNNKKKIKKKDNENSISKLNTNKDNQKLLEKVIKIMEYTDDEKNGFTYELALQFDKRTFCECYISLIKTKHNFIFAFFFNNDYNSKIIQIDIYFLSFAIFYTVNALFFDDNTMHKIYENNGKLNIEYQIPKIIYSSLISMALNMVIQMLALSNDAIIDFKQDKSKNNLLRRKTDLERNLKLRFILYIIISFVLLLFFWYYLSMFGAIYKNTQYYLLKDTLISFGLAFFDPFFIYLFPGIFRRISLSTPKKNRKYLYNLSKIFNIFS